MNSILLTRLLLISIIFGSCNQKKTDSILWSLQTKNSKNKAYIFGSMHYIPPHYVPNLSKVNKIFDSVNMVVFEYNPTDSFFIKKQLNAYQPKPALSYFNKNEITYLKKILIDSIGYDCKTVDTFLNEPINVFDEYMIDILFKPIYIDMEYYKKAKYLNKIIGGLDTGYEYVQYYKMYGSLLNQRWYANDSILKEFNLNVNKMFKAYSKEMSIIIGNYRSKDSIGVKEAEIVDLRNKIWINRINSIVKNNNVLFVVGVGHLGGYNGLINKLKQKGYIAKPI